MAPADYNLTENDLVLNTNWSNDIVNDWQKRALKITYYVTI